MSDQEFIVLDELYFLQSFQELEEQTGYSKEILNEVLGEMLGKGWIKCLRSRQGEEPVPQTEFKEHYASFLYLATKAGLLAHNSR